MNIKPIKLNDIASNITKPINNYTLPALMDLPIDKFAHEARVKEQELISKNGLQTTCEKLFALAQDLLAGGKMDFAGIICSRLAKYSQLPSELKEKYIQQAIEIAELQGDKFHMVARFRDLQDLYSNTRELTKLQKVLAKQERVLKDIVEDFDGALDSYRTINPKTKPKNVESFEDILATILVDLAKFLQYSKPKKARKKLLEAMDLFKKFGDMERYKYAEKMLTYTEHKLSGNL